MTSVLAHLGDRVNPIVVKEVRQAVNSRIVAGALLLFLAVQLVVMSFQLLARNYSPADGAIDLKAGREVFGIVQGILVGTCILIIPAFTGARLAGERSEVNVDLMFITSLSPWKIISGKFLASAALVLLIFSACAPFMTFAYVLRGLDIPTILVILYADFLAVLLGTIFAIFLAAIPSSRVFRILLALSGFGGLIGLTYFSLGVGYAFLLGRLVLDVGRLDFWLVLGSVSVGILGLIGLFFVWSVALITPVSANRALPVRLYTFGFWLVTGVGCFLGSGYLKDPGPVLAWLVGSSLVFWLQMAIGISERDEWGPRLRRRIPRRWLPRVLVFLFYSGSAGGIVFAVIGGLSSVLVVELASVLRPDWSLLSSDRAIKFAALLLGYSYCYGMSAVVLRRLGKGRGVQPFHTWAIGCVLLGIGSVLPYIFAEVLFDRQTRRLYAPTTHPIYYTSPVVTISRTSLRYSEPENLFPVAAFLICWGSLVTLLNVPWLAQQVSKFRPLSPKTDRAITKGDVQ